MTTAITPLNTFTLVKLYNSPLEKNRTIYRCENKQNNSHFIPVLFALIVRVSLHFMTNDKKRMITNFYQVLTAFY